MTAKQQKSKVNLGVSKLDKFFVTVKRNGQPIEISWADLEDAATNNGVLTAKYLRLLNDARTMARFYPPAEVLIAQTNNSPHVWEVRVRTLAGQVVHPRWIVTPNNLPSICAADEGMQCYSYRHACEEARAIADRVKKLFNQAGPPMVMDLATVSD